MMNENSYNLIDEPWIPVILKSGKNKQDFSWANQCLAVVTLWAASVYIVRHFDRRYSMVTALPGMFMSGVCSTYILMAPEGLGLSMGIAYPAGIIFAVLCMALFMAKSYLRSGTGTAAGSY